MPYLIVSTPRAGDWNHRTLVAPNWTSDGLALDQLLAMARQQAQGPFWLSVSRDVKQKNSEREGQEMLILGDLDVTHLNDPNKRDAILDLLQRRLENDLDALITTDIDWKAEGKTDPVVRQEISDWYRSDFQPMNLPESQSPLWNSDRALALVAMKKKASKNKDRNKKIIMFLGGSAAILLTSLAAYYYDPSLSNTDSEPRHEETYNCKGNICNVIGKEGDTCRINKEERDKLAGIFKLSEDDPSCMPEDVEIPNNFKEIFINFNKDKKIPLADVLTSKKITEEFFGVQNKEIGGKKIAPEQYKEIREYQRKIRDAWTVLNNFSIQESKLADLTRPWNKDNYNAALSDLRKFLDDCEETIKNKKELETFNKLEIFFAEGGFFKSCSNKKINTIKRKINENCNANNLTWQVIEELKDKNQETKNFVEVFEAIMKLTPPTIESSDQNL